MKHVNDLLQRVIFDALANDEYTVEEIRENVDVAIERAEEYLADEDTTTDEQRARLEYLRGELRAERISWGELNELQGLAPHIDPGDVELLEAAGVPEHAEEED